MANRLIKKKLRLIAYLSLINLLVLPFGSDKPISEALTVFLVPPNLWLHSADWDYEFFILGL